MTSGWSFVLVSGNTIDPTGWTEQSDLTAATAKKLTVYLDQPHEITFDMNGMHPEALLIGELFCDVIAYHDNGDGTGPVKQVRARVGPTSDTADGTSITTNYKALSYRELLGRKILYDGDSILTYAATVAQTQENIAWNLIAAAQGRTNGTLGITRGTPAASSGVSVIHPFEAGMVVGEQVAQVAATDTGFDWDIGPDLVYMTYYPLRGRTTLAGQFPLDYGGSVASFTRSVEPADYANAVRVSGGTPDGGSAPTPSAQTSAEVTAGTAVQGRWERQLSDQDLLTTALVAKRATKLLSDAQVLQPTYSMTLTPGMWTGPADMWLGDTVPVLIQAGRLNVDTSLRVTSMEFGIGDDGDDKVTVTLGGLSLIDRFYQKQKKVFQDIARLERR